jgi:uncharacterized membrane protein YhaH (DUF805 family)
VSARSPSSATRRVLTVSALLVAVLLAWINGLVVWWLALYLHFDGRADRGDYLVGAGACGATAVLLFVALAALLVFRPPWWLLVTTALGVSTQLALSITTYRQAQELPFELDSDYSDFADDPFAAGMGFALQYPGSWALVVALVIAVLALARRIRARWSPGPQPRPVR